MTPLRDPQQTTAPRLATGRRGARRLAAAIVAVAAFSGLTQVALAGPVPPEVPSRIQVEDGNKLFLVGHAVGVQIYSCNATASGFAWALVGPRANLYNDHGKLIATHFGGPTWQAKDGSTVVGSVVDRVSVDPTTIDWLLLSAASSAGPDGDRLAGTTFIQRIATTGGRAPAAANCNLATAGTREEIPYTADYLFWKATGA
jgi:FtsP/CotA-like multicopper oxidase with cupredoxin domain